MYVERCSWFVNVKLIERNDILRSAVQANTLKAPVVFSGEFTPLNIFAISAGSMREGSWLQETRAAQRVRGNRWLTGWLDVGWVRREGLRRRGEECRRIKPRDRGREGVVVLVDIAYPRRHLLLFQPFPSLRPWLIPLLASPTLYDSLSFQYSLRSLLSLFLSLPSSPSPFPAFQSSFILFDVRIWTLFQRTNFLTETRQTRSLRARKGFLNTRQTELNICTQLQF